MPTFIIQENHFLKVVGGKLFITDLYFSPHIHLLTEQLINFLALLHWFIRALHPLLLLTLWLHVVPLHLITDLPGNWLALLYIVVPLHLPHSFPVPYKTQSFRYEMTVLAFYRHWFIICKLFTVVIIVLLTFFYQYLKH